MLYCTVYTFDYLSKYTVAKIYMNIKYMFLTIFPIYCLYISVSSKGKVMALYSRFDVIVS